VSRIGIDGRADARAFRAEQAAIRPHRLDQQFERRRGIEHRVEIQELEPVTETIATTPQRWRVEPPELIGDRAAAVRDDDLEIRKILEHVGVQQPQDR
jgi:hypothetical protein